MVSQHPHLLAQTAYDRGLDQLPAQSERRRMPLASFQRDDPASIPNGHDAHLECGKLFLDRNEFEQAAVAFAEAVVRPPAGSGRGPTRSWARPSLGPAEV